MDNEYRDNYNLNASNRSGVFEYDLNKEKEEAGKITQRVMQDLLIRWKKSYAGAQIFPASVSAMHPEVVNFLLSFDLVDAYDDIAKQTGLDENGRNLLPKIVWKISQSKQWNLLETLLQEKLSNYSVASIAQLLKERILNKVISLSEKPFIQKNSSFGEVSAPVQKLIKLPLSEALTQFPKIAEQGITIDQISIRSFPAPARPSIKNWISDYHDKNGVGKHSPIDRGNYLFHSDNGKKLSPIERQKLGIILKSLDEQSVLNIDTEKQIVVFESEIASVQKTNIESKTSNEEPVDIFDLKINTLGKSLQKNTTLQNAAVPSLNKSVNEANTQNFVAPIQNVVDVSRLKNIPPNLPVEKSSLENDLHKEDNQPVQIESVEFNDIKIEPAYPKENLEVKNDNRTLDFNELHTESKIEDKPKVELKNISFSPNFIAIPKEEESKSQTLRGSINPLPEHIRIAPLKSQTLPTQPKEEIFSIPGSKPPIGTEHYDINKTEEEKISALANRALESLPNPVSNSDSKKIVEQLSAVKEVSLAQNEDKKVLDDNTGNINLNDLDSLSDEMLFKLYQEKKNSNHNTSSLNPNKPRGFHIGSAKPSDENGKIKNIVDLKNL